MKAQEVRPAEAAGQEMGTISGYVSNQATAAPLSGATIQIEGSTLRTATERDGTFTLNVSPGSYTLSVTYTGLDSERISVVVEAGKRVSRDIPLTSKVYLMEKFSVLGLREGNALAIQMQRQAPNAKTVVSTDTFGAPAGNPGEVIQRLPGVTVDINGGEVQNVFIRGMSPAFSALMVDGERIATSTGVGVSRDYQVTQLGTGTLEAVELIKAPTPDQDANAVAGFINLISKRSFDLRERRVSLIAGAIWNQRHSNSPYFKDNPDNLDIFNFSYADSFGLLGKPRSLGVAFNLTRRVSSLTQEEIGAGGQVGASGGFIFPAGADPIQRYWGGGESSFPTRQYNVGLNLDYKLSESSLLYINTTYNNTRWFQRGNRWIVSGGTAAAQYAPGSNWYYEESLPNALSISELRSKELPFYSRNYSVRIGSEHKLFNGAGKLELSVNQSYANHEYPHYNEVIAHVTGIGWRLDRRNSDPWFPAFAQTSGPSIYDPKSYRPSARTELQYRAPNNLRGWRADYRHDIPTVIPAYIKVGVKYNDDRREQDQNNKQFSWAGPDGVVNNADDYDMSAYVANKNPYRLNDNRYGPFSFPTWPDSRDANSIVKAPYWTQTSADAYNSAVANKANDASFKERVQSAYILGNTQIGRLRILGGVRVENTKVEGTGWLRDPSATAGGNSITTLPPAANAARAEASFKGQVTNRGEYRKVFPGLHFVYELRDGLLVRASYNTSISRPPPPNTLPITTSNVDTRTVSVGNPNLKPYTSNNFDFSIQKYFEPVGLFEVSLFLKEIKDYFRAIPSIIGTGPDNGFDGDYAGYTLNQVQNTGNARIRGVELSHQQQFSFLPGPWRGLGAFANYTYQQAEGDFGTTLFQKRLAGFANRSGNVGLSYLGYGWDARILGSYKGDTYRGGAGIMSVYDQPRWRIDLKFQYAVNRHYYLFFDILNLKDSPGTAQELENHLKYFASRQGAAFNAGIRGRF